MTRRFVAVVLVLVISLTIARLRTQVSAARAYVECLVKAGLTPLQALQAATGWAAECLGRERDLGTVEKGKLADLIVVASDPLSDVTILQNPERIALVLKDGKIAANRLAKTEAMQR